MKSHGVVKNDLSYLNDHQYTLLKDVENIKTVVERAELERMKQRKKRKSHHDPYRIEDPERADIGSQNFSSQKTFLSQGA
jgi:hypothetical protein